ncbi:hypothetical protein HNP84_009620 [Thermocatellispora tengchongensis]|uniref:Uncharacterized protein n=1 Tax=Thermocatellispora tengchongensis TaxID=1073253 RepID=A0A840PLR6_9ACTN|nr:hypothetical protein [Thermocatellispora tengchongensis]
MIFRPFDIEKAPALIDFRIVFVLYSSLDQSERHAWLGMDLYAQCSVFGYMWQFL